MRNSAKRWSKTVKPKVNWKKRLLVEEAQERKKNIYEGNLKSRSKKAKSQTNKPNQNTVECWLQTKSNWITHNKSY